MTQRPSGRRWSRGPILLLVPAAVLVIGGAALAGLWEFSSSPTFCGSCHIMRPYVEAWKVSGHRRVACVQCHYPPGFRDTLWVKYQAITQVAKWATGTYSSKPFAEVEDASCLRSGCHARTQLESEGPVILTRGVRFDHRPHLDPAKTGRQLRCTSCHSQQVVDRHVEVDRRPCFLCHFKGTKRGRELTPIAGCTGCHEPPTGDIVVGSVRFNHGDVVRRGVACQKCHLNVVDGDGEAPAERCLTCHNRAEQLRRYAEARLLHDVHVTRRSIECTRCHTQIEHKLPPPIGIPRAARQREGLLVAAQQRP
ncbi:MAG: NapC/NirT family cytochrome c [Candidatus Rokubacteria bacterium]|nr:NapC/NirT family cytochrome c [Candidatus Rokubacteria bacterium]